MWAVEEEILNFFEVKVFCGIEVFEAEVLGSIGEGEGVVLEGDLQHFEGGDGLEVLETVAVQKEDFPYFFGVYKGVFVLDDVEVGFEETEVGLFDDFVDKGVYFVGEVLEVFALGEVKDSEDENVLEETVFAEGSGVFETGREEGKDVVIGLYELEQQTRVRFQSLVGVKERVGILTDGLEN